MRTEIIMPRAAQGMESGTVHRWLKGAGDVLARGEPLLEIETDKATLEIESPVDGTLVEIIHPDGTEVPVGAVIGYVEAVGS